MLVGEELVGEPEVLLFLRPLLPRPHAEAHREEEVVVLARTQRLEGRVPRGDVLLEAVVRELVLERGAVAEIPYPEAAVLVGDEAGAYQVTLWHVNPPVADGGSRAAVDGHGQEVDARAALLDALPDLFLEDVSHGLADAPLVEARPTVTRSSPE